MALFKEFNKKNYHNWKKYCNWESVVTEISIINEESISVPFLLKRRMLHDAGMIHSLYILYTSCDSTIYFPFKPGSHLY